MMVPGGMMMAHGMKHGWLKSIIALRAQRPRVGCWSFAPTFCRCLLLSCLATSVDCAAAPLASTASGISTVVSSGCRQGEAQGEDVRQVQGRQDGQALRQVEVTRSPSGAVERGPHHERCPLSRVHCIQCREIQVKIAPGARPCAEYWLDRAHCPH